MRARALAVELNRLKADLVDLDRCIAILQANEDAVQHQQLLQLPPASSSSALGSSPSRHAQPQTLSLSPSGRDLFSERGLCAGAHSFSADTAAALCDALKLLR